MPRFSLKSFLLWSTVITVVVASAYRFLIWPAFDDANRAHEMSEFLDRVGQVPLQLGPWDGSANMPDGEHFSRAGDNVVLLRAYQHGNLQKPVVVQITFGPQGSVSQAAAALEDGDSRDLGTIEFNPGDAQHTARFRVWMSPADSPPRLHVSGMSDSGSWSPESEARQKLEGARHCYYVQASVELPSENPTEADIESAKQELDDFLHHFVPAANQTLFEPW